MSRLRGRLREVWRRLRGLGARGRERRLARELRALPLAGLMRGDAHGLDAPLVLSLTSYPARFGVLELTLRALMAQTVRPDRMLLWLAEADVAALPGAVRELAGAGLEIRTCDDIRSFKKIVPTLEAFPDAFIVTADDDLYYHREWLAELVEGWRDAPGAPVAHRMHRIVLDAAGVPLPYASWPKRVASPHPHPLNFPTSGAGVLYPPGAFAPEVLDRARFSRLCPDSDDLWLYWMMRRAGHSARGCESRFRCWTWPAARRGGLLGANVYAGGNDRQVRALIEDMGMPAGPPT